MSRVDLSNGQWVELREPEDITSGDRKAYMKLLEKMNDGATSVDVTIAFFLTDWSLSDFPRPGWSRTTGLSNVPSLDELRAVDLDRIAKRCQQIVKGITPNFDVDPDPTSPTGPSGD